jgi:hypothetical protein
MSGLTRHSDLTFDDLGAPVWIWPEGEGTAFGLSAIKERFPRPWDLMCAVRPG